MTRDLRDLKPDGSRPATRWRIAAWAGALWAIVLAFPWAAAVALVYGFPVPFAGKLRGLDAVVPSLRAVLYYGALGGFAVLGLLGAAAGAAAQRVGGSDRPRVYRLCLLLSALVSGACIAFLAVLDRIIGPW